MEKRNRRMRSVGKGVLCNGIFVRIDRLGQDWKARVQSCML